MSELNLKRDIAIIGMAGLFPKAPDVYTFWHNIMAGVGGVDEPPADAWDVHTAYDPDSDDPARIYTRRGGYLGTLATFNPLKHGVPPQAVAGTEPAQWLALEAARNALADAGYADGVPQKQRTAVIIGRGTYINRGNTTHYQHGTLIDETVRLVAQLNPDYDVDDLAYLRAELRRGLPPFDATVAQGLIPNIIAGRIANKLDLMGPAYTVDAACASSVVALEQAVKGLRGGDYDLALVGGSYVVSPAPMAMVFAQLRVLSRSGAIRPFSADGDGTLLGEGIGMVVLKRADEALRDGDPIYAVIRGVGTASDGSGKSVIAPNHAGAVAAIRRALADAQVDPAAVGLIEAHGLGTRVGDTVEFGALHAVYGKNRQPVALGSVKPMTGHLMPASGVAGLIKAALALHFAKLPPTLNADHPDPALPWRDSALSLLTEAHPWLPLAHGPRHAALNSFGFGGVAAHAILAQAPQGARRPNLQPLAYLDEPGRVRLVTNARTLHLSDQATAELQRRAAAHRPAVAPAQPTTAPISVTGENSMTHNAQPHPLAPAMMATYAELMKQFLNVQRDVMIAALGAAPITGGGEDNALLSPAVLAQLVSAAPVPTAATLAPRPADTPSNGHYATEPTKAPPPAARPAAPPPQPAPAQQAAPASAPATRLAADDLQRGLLAIVAERTGYPAEMIDLDVDLEADLGIDSIKRVEILGAFQKQFGAAIGAVALDDLAEQKTLRAIINFVVNQG